MAKKIELEQKQEVKQESNEIKVIGIIEAEKLQKQGLKFISAKMTKEGKQFTFLKG